MKKLSVVIVSYNVKHYLEQCLVSLLRAVEGIDAEVIVVDNHSHDDSVGYLRPRFPHVAFVSLVHNLGFAGANNIGIERAKGEYVLLLNPDTIVAEPTLHRALDFMDAHPRAGALGVKMLTSEGGAAPESRRGLPTPLTALYKMTGLCARFPRSRRFARYYLGHLSWDEAAQIDVVSGAFCLLRHEALTEVGGLDEDYFMYGEDIDLSYCLQKKGYENWYLPETILHYKGESTRRTTFTYVHVFYGSMLIFLRKHFGNLGLLLSIPIKVAILLKAAIALISIAPRMLKRFLGMRVRKVKGNQPRYVVIGSAQAQEECRQIFDHYAVSASFVDGSANSLPDGHNSVTLPDGGGHTYVVYDMDSYSFADVLSIFSRFPRKNTAMGFYVREAGTIVTSQDVFVF